MRLTLIFLLFYVGNSFGQKMKLSPDEIKEKINALQVNSIHVDSLKYVDSTCSYLKDEAPYSGYVIHFIDSLSRFNLFENGKYDGEEWIFGKTGKLLGFDSLSKHLIEFRLNSDTNEFFMIVTSYYDFESNRIHEIYIDNRYQCAKRVSDTLPTFDQIFGGDNIRELNYKSYYSNGNKKEISEGNIVTEGKLIKYYENGKKESVMVLRGYGKNGKIKEFDEDGKCTKRFVFRNEKIRGVYVIFEGKMTLSVIGRYRAKKR